MKLYRFIIILASVLSYSTCAYASGVTAQSLLKEVGDRINSSAGVTADFTITTAHDGSKGTITISGDKFFIETPAITTWYDGLTQWTYSPITSEVNIAEPSKEELTEVNPFLIISTVPTAYNSRLIPASSGNYRIDLKAKAQDLAVNHAIITISAETKLPNAIEITTPHGESFTIAIDRITIMKNINPDIFKFNHSLYKDVEIIDLR